MKSIKLFVTMCILLLSINSKAQNVGINNSNPQAALDLQGDLRLRSAVLTLPTNLNHNVDLITTKSSVYMFGGGALSGCQITGFTGGVDGRMITIFNNSTTNAVQLYDASNGISIANSAAANRILTGTGNSAVIYGNGSVTLRYDGAKASWVVTGSNYVDGLSTAATTQWNVAGNNISNNNSGNVGVGTANPVKKLEINSGAANQSGLRLSQYASTTTDVNVTDVLADVTSVTGLAFDNAGNCYATNFDNNKIHKISAAGVVSDFVVTGLSQPHDIVFGPDGNLYVSNYTSGIISKITLAGAITTISSGFQNPIGLTFDNAGYLYVVNGGDGRLSRVNVSSGSTFYAFGTGLTSPYGCVFNAPNNTVYIANYGANEIAQINLTTGGLKTTFKAGVDFCTGINIDASGNIYAAQAAPNKVVKITQAGVVSDYATTTYPFDITFYNGKLYMANQTINKISVLNEVSNFLAVDNAGDVVRVKAGNLLQPTGQSLTTWTVAGNNQTSNNSGNVGIGEPAPTEKLQVNNGNAKIGGGLWATATDDKVLKFGDQNYVTIGEVGGDDKMEIKANEITLKAVSGKVLVPLGGIGIHTTTPIAPLSFANEFGDKICLWNINNTTQLGMGIQGGTMQFYTGNGDRMAFGFGSSNSFNETMTFYPGSGQLGVGTTNVGAYKLAVNGNIRSKEVTVETDNWPDFVFDKKYNLPSLKNVEAFISEHNHLPNIPSAKEIETNGLQLGDVQKKMMQKIEELTLYIIEQNKRIEKLEAEKLQTNNK